MFKPFRWAVKGFIAEAQNLATNRDICPKDELGGSLLTAGGISTAIILFRLPRAAIKRIQLLPTLTPVDIRTGVLDAI
jgi:hypothetical protein